MQFEDLKLNFQNIQIGFLHYQIFKFSNFQINN
jgi:hypothetical protein